MALYSNPRRGFFSQSLLPSSSRKPKPQKKARRGTLIIDLIFSNIFLFGLCVSFLFFFVVFLLYGVPSPISSRLHPSPVRVLRARNPTHVYAGGDGFATVDITMKDLYEKIEFLDEDGGAWKQGWAVSYSGDEWLEEKLKVFVVPHSHNDPGWKLTVEEYYQKQSRHILDTVVDSLSKDSRRRFIWEEMSYLERWWRDSTKEKKKSLIRLVKNGQLEIVGGGWVMNDEANSHYYAILEQMTEGNTWLNETIGVVPKNSWAIDPFGYSPTMAYLLRRMGFENMLIQRTHYEVKKELALAQNLEFVWRQSWDSEETTDIFVHMMPFYSYDIPHTCGPDPSVCCQFDFARAPPFTYERCPWGQHPLPITRDNVRERAPLLLDQYRKKSILYRTKTLLIPLGDDFRYVDGAEAEAQFQNYQLLFDHINSDPTLRADVRFGTLDEYFQAVRGEVGRRNYTRTWESGSAQIAGFPSLSGDFFTYADRNLDYWSGYYVSRPFFKAVDRVLEHTLRSAEIMMVFLLGYCQRPSCERFPVSFGHKLTAARRNLALFQHHDGVTGTARDHVVVDYGSRMHTSLHDLQIFMSKAVEVLLGIRHGKLDQMQAQFEAETQRSKYDAQAVHKVIHLREGVAHQVVFFNPSEQTRNEVVTVTLSRPDVTVLTSAWDCLPGQVSPEFLHSRSDPFSGRHRLHWQASLPPLGLQTYYLTTTFTHCPKSDLAELTFYTNMTSVPCPKPYICSISDQPLAEIANRHQRLRFDARLGLLREIIHPNDARVEVGEEVAMYTGSESGAYLFKPDGEAISVVRCATWFVVVHGRLLREAFSYPETAWETAPFSQSTRVYEGTDTVQEYVIEKEYHVEMVGQDFDNREMILRFRTDVDNHRIFYTDLNGFQMSRRDTCDKIPIQGNYYPMPSLAFLQDSGGARFSVHSRQSLGAAGLAKGWLEIMLDRRLVKDDGRGLGQGIIDNRPMNILFHILYESNTSAVSSPLGGPVYPSLLSHLVGSRLNYPVQVFVSKKARDTSSIMPVKTFSPLVGPLPCDLHIVTMKVARPLRLPDPGGLRFALVVHRLRFDGSYCRKGRVGCTLVGDIPVNLFYVFREMHVVRTEAASLNLVNENTEDLGYGGLFEDVAREGNVLIAPMEIQAYRFDLSPRK